MLNPDEQLILDKLAEHIKNCKIIGEKAVISEFSITVSLGWAVFQNSAVNPEMYGADVLFIIDRPDLDCPIEEPTATTGMGKDNAAANIVDYFIKSVLFTVTMSFDCEGENEIESDTSGTKLYFRRACYRPVLYMGNAKGGKTMWEHIENSIAPYLGTKNFYWIKLFASRYDGDTEDCEVRLNNTVYNGLSDKLAEFAKAEFPADGFSSQKEFIILVRKDKAPNMREYAEKIKKLVYESIKILSSSKNLDEASDKVFGICGDGNLAYEMCYFIPEIYTHEVLNIYEPDEIVINVRGTQSVIMKSALNNYTYIEYAVRAYLAEKQPSEDENMNVMWFSSKMNAIQRAVTKGIDPEIVKMNSITFNAPDDYKLF